MEAGAAQDNEHAAAFVYLTIALVGEALLRNELASISVSWYDRGDTLQGYIIDNSVFLAALIGYGLLAPWKQIRFRLAVPPGMKRAIGVVLIAAIVSFLLDFAGAWPFMWRNMGKSSIAFAHLVIATKSVPTLFVQFLVTACLIPAVEEIIFRSSLLNWALAKTNSRIAASLISGLVFGLAHFGPAPASWLNGAWLIIGGFGLAILATSRSGGLKLAWLAHAARNMIELGTLYMIVLSISRQ